MTYLFNKKRKLDDEVIPMTCPVIEGRQAGRRQIGNKVDSTRLKDST